MSSFSQNTLFKVLEWLLIIGLTVCSLFFMTDVWKKFQARKTSFTTYQEIRTEMPTTVLCFSPFGKMSAINKYNITIQDLGMSHL